MLAPSAYPEHVLTAQAGFRAVMEAMARPGAIVPCRRGDATVPPPLEATAAVVATALMDYETPFWLDAPLASSSAVDDWIRFHTGAPRVADPQHALFAFVADPERLPPFEAFALGSDAYPDRSTTLVLQVRQLGEGHALHLRGPGIHGVATLAAAPLPADMADRLVANRALFPRGVDLVLVAPGVVAALPRSSRVGARA